MLNHIIYIKIVNTYFWLDCNATVENDENVENVVSWSSCRYNNHASWEMYKIDLYL